MHPHPKKSLGQHFLRDTGIIDRIMRLLDPKQEDLVVEIGAGDGALSARLASKVGHLVAIEIDPDCLPHLIRVLSGHPHARIIHENVLSLDLDGVLAPYSKVYRMRVIGNLPYYIATPIIERMLRLENRPSDMLFMVQREVAERITANPGSSQYGFYSVFCQHYCEARIAFTVSPACFVPRPNVISAIIALKPYREVRKPEFERALLEVTKAAFAHRRKKLINSLRRNPSFGPSAGELLEAGAVSANVRAEELTVGEYRRLAELWCSMAHKNYGQSVTRNEDGRIT